MYFLVINIYKSCGGLRTIFEVDIDTFEEKPWGLAGIDISDFFNFGLNEDSWKDYCKQLVSYFIDLLNQMHESNCGFLYQDDKLMPTIKYAGTTPPGGNYAKQDSCL